MKNKTKTERASDKYCADNMRWVGECHGLMALGDVLCMEEVENYGQLRELEAKIELLNSITCDCTPLFWIGDTETGTDSYLTQLNKQLSALKTKLEINP